MQDSKNILEYLNERFTKVRETETGYRVNVNELNRLSMASLLSIPDSPEILVKRSGAQLVVIINT